jgi:hypothetical protein
MSRALALIGIAALLAACRGPNPAFDDPGIGFVDAAAGGRTTGGGAGAGGNPAGGSGGDPGTGGTPNGGNGTGGDVSGGAGTGGGAGDVDTGPAPDLAPQVDLSVPPPDATTETPPASPPDVTPADINPPSDLAGDGGDGIQHGLHADYFDDTTLTKLAYTQIDPKLEFAWAKAAPDPRLDFTRGWSVRWTGKLKPRFSEVYQLIAHAGDGVRVFIDGKEVITDWMPHTDRDASTSLMLSGTRSHDIKVEYNFVSGWAVVRLGWSSPSQPREIIPAEAYTP